MFDKTLNPGGLYLLEDIEILYWKKGQDLYGHPVTRGGYTEPHTVINKLKHLVDVDKLLLFYMQPNKYHV